MFSERFYVRKSLAALYFGEEISLPILAKLLAIETIDSRAFKKLYTTFRSMQICVLQSKAEISSQEFHIIVC